MSTAGTDELTAKLIAARDAAIDCVESADSFRAQMENLWRTKQRPAALRQRAGELFTTHKTRLRSPWLADEPTLDAMRGNERSPMKAWGKTYSTGHEAAKAWLQGCTRWLAALDLARDDQLPTMLALLTGAFAGDKSEIIARIKIETDGTLNRIEKQAAGAPPAPATPTTATRTVEKGLRVTEAACILEIGTGQVTRMCNGENKTYHLETNGLRGRARRITRESFVEVATAMNKEKKHKRLNARLRKRIDK